MTDYASMTIDNLIAYRDQWPAQRTEWNRAELALQKRLAVVDELCRLCGELDAEGVVLIQNGRRAEEAIHNLISLARPKFSDDIQMLALSEAKWVLEQFAAAPLPASPSSVED